MDSEHKQNTVVLSLFAMGTLLCLLGLIAYFTHDQSMVTLQSQADTQFTLQSDTISTLSAYDDSGNATFYSLMSQSKDRGLYRLNDISPSAAVAFLSNKPTFVLYGSGEHHTLLPDDANNIRLRKSATDKELTADLDSTFGLNNVDTQSTHFYFEQTRCEGVPVFGAYVNMHVANSGNVYAVSGALIEDEPSCTRTLSEAQAQAKAQEAFGKKFGSNDTRVHASQPYIYSSRIMRGGGAKSYLSEYVTICNPAYCHAYFVDRADGTIRDDMQITTDAKNRYVYLNSTQRREGAGPVSNSDVNKAYDIMGNVWDYYSNTHQRDSYDNRGGMIQVQLRSCNDISASWNGQQISSCTGIADTDVLAHEFQHGVTQYTAGLVYSNESGAMNEGLSDSFASAIDSDDWLMGEEGIRAIRSLQNPPQFGHPDSMVHTKFYCGSGDNGGVHINSGVLNKTYYLMSDGGTFNGCTMNGLGREKAIKIIYKAITTYMNGKSSGKYKDMYDAINLACNDIHTAGSAECANVKAAMESTYMNKPSRCNGGTASGATCAGGTQQPPPSTTPSPSDTPQPSPSMPAPSQAPDSEKQASLLSILSSPKFISGEVKVTKTSTTTRIYSTLQSAAIQSLAEERGLDLDAPDTVLDVRGRLIGKDVIETGHFVQRDSLIFNDFSTDRDVSDYDSYQVYFTKTNDHNELPVLVGDLVNKSTQEEQKQDAVIVDLTLRLQGIDKKPPSTQAQLVRVGLSGDGVEGTIYKKAVFTPNDQGLWTGRVIFNGISGVENGAIRIKASKHIQKKYCQNSPKEKHPGLYLCEYGALSLTKGINALDYSKVVQMAGDVNQDGRVNAADIGKIRGSIGSTSADDLMFGDVNSDGVINSIDDALSIYTLSNKAQQS